MDGLHLRALLLAAGLLVCFRGYSTLKAALALTAFLLGAHAVVLRADLVPPDPRWLLPAAATAAGVLLALLVWAAYRLGVTLLGAAAFVLLALGFPEILPADRAARLLVLGLAALAGGLLARLVERVVLSVATAAYGSFMAVSAAFGTAAASTVALPLARDARATAHPEWFLLAWAVLALAGAVVQLRPRE